MIINDFYKFAIYIYHVYSKIYLKYYNLTMGFSYKTNHKFIYLISN